MRMSPLAIAIVLSAAVSPALAQTYTIKLKSRADEGTTYVFQSVVKETGTTKVLDSDGKLLKEDGPKDREKEYAATILEKGKDPLKPSKFVRVYKTATETQEGKTKELPHQARTIVFELKEGSYLVGAAGKPALNSDELSDVIEKVNQPGRDIDKVVVPGKAVAVGDRWTIDPEAFAETAPFKMALDKSACSGEAKLTKVYTRGQSQFGIIKFKVKLALKVVEQFEFDPPAQMEFDVTIDAAIDGSSLARKETSVLKLKGKGVMQAGEKKITLDLDKEMQGREECSEEKNDPKARKVPAVEYANAWTEVKNRFAAKFPGTPKVKTDKRDSSTTTTWSVTVDKGKINYLVAFTEFADGNADADPREFMKRLTDQYAKSIKEKKEVTVDGNIGIEFSREEESAGQKFVVSHRAFLVKGQVYQAIAVVDASLDRKAEVKRFLEAFRFRPKDAGKAEKKDAP